MDNPNNNSYFSALEFSKEEMIALGIKMHGTEYPSPTLIEEKVGLGPESIHIIKNYISPSSIDALRDFLTFCHDNTKIIHMTPEIEKIAMEITKECVEKIKLTAENLFDLTLEYEKYANKEDDPQEFPKNLLVARKPHFVTAVHADNLNSNRYELEGYQWSEHISNLLYLNDDYSGGELYFPEHDISIKPEPGMLISFPGHFWNRHGIFPANKLRYAVSIFYKIKSF